MVNPAISTGSERSGASAKPGTSAQAARAETSVAAAVTSTWARLGGEVTSPKQPQELTSPSRQSPAATTVKATKHSIWTKKNQVPPTVSAPAAITTSATPMRRISGRGTTRPTR